MLVADEFLPKIVNKIIKQYENDYPAVCRDVEQ